MGIENVSTDMTSDTAKFYTGMTRKEAYFKLNDEEYYLFNFADDDCNDTISEAEMRRFKGPLLVVEKDDRTKQRFIGEYQGRAGLSSHYGKVNGEVVGLKEFDFYPGQKYDQIHDREFNLAFRDLDINAPYGELSEEEIKAYQNYYDRKAELKQTIEENKSIKSDNIYNSSLGGVFGFLLGGMFGFAGSHFVASKVYDSLLSNQKFWKSKLNHNVDYEKVPKLLGKLAQGKLNWPIGLGITAIGVTAGLLIAKACHKKQTPLDKFDDLKPLDEQYKNVYNA